MATIGLFGTDKSFKYNSFPEVELAAEINK
jgi:hypothetical protein